MRTRGTNTDLTPSPLPVMTVKLNGEEVTLSKALDAVLAHAIHQQVEIARLQAENAELRRLHDMMRQYGEDMKAMAKLDGTPRPRQSFGVNVEGSEKAK